MKGFRKFKYYGPAEWASTLIGLAVCGRTTYRYMIGLFDDYELLDYSIPVGSIAFGLIMMTAPLDVMDWFRGKVGMVSKRDKIEKKEFIARHGIDPDKEIK